jgi:hypothetical protein
MWRGAAPSRDEDPMKSCLIKRPPFPIPTSKENLVRRVGENGVNLSAHEVSQRSNISTLLLAIKGCYK